MRSNFMDRRDILTKVIVGAMIKKGDLDIRSMHRNAANTEENTGLEKSEVLMITAGWFR